MQIQNSEAANTERANSFPWLELSPTVLHARQTNGDIYRVTQQTRVVIGTESLRPLAKRLADGLALAAQLPASLDVVLTEAVVPGDVVLRLADVPTSDIPIPAKGVLELYRIDISSMISVTAKSLQAMALALTTLHKAARVSYALTWAEVIDAPSQSERSVLIDVGRKHYSVGWMKDLLREMAWNQLNTLYLHLTDNEGVRIKFPSHPDLSSPDAWTAAELDEILQTANAYYIEVIPGIEPVGHMGYILSKKIQFQLKLDSGAMAPRALDFSIPAARTFVTELVDDLLELFPSCKFVNLEADEYFLDPVTINNTSQLAKYAKDQSGNPSAGSQDGFRYFVNELAERVQARGKTVRVWNDSVTQKNPIIPISTTIDILCWSIWGSKRNEMNVDDLIKAGYNVLNAHGDFYFVIRSGWTNLIDSKHSPYGLYNIWRLNHFMDEAGEKVTIVEPDNPKLKGGGIQIWADEAVHMTPEKVLADLKLWLLPLGQHSWGSPHAPARYDDLGAVARSVSSAPPEH
ncbi:family 20 glycosylhydrolase [Pseudomonas sp. R1-15]|uniref:family 20 glycosylhydrolase n=1 Tax=Pseudomonas sp. R1-15 TaxID=2817399 RepID=UPI003DA91912